MQTLAPEFRKNSKTDILDSEPGIDPINIKNDYFSWINANDPTPSFGKLLQIAKDNRQSAPDIIAAVNAATTIPNSWRAALSCCGISAPGTSRRI